LLHLRYGPSVALSTLSPCRYLREPKTRFSVEWLRSLPRRELHPLEAPGFSWRTEEGLYICLQYPLHFASICRSMDGFYRVMRAALGPETIRAIQKVLLVDGLQHLAYCALYDLVLYR